MKSSLMTPHEALELVLNGERFDSLDHLPQDVQARFALAQEQAPARARLANPERMSDMVRLLDASRTASTRKKQVVWIQRAAQAFSVAHAPQAACSSGCSHCCHIPVKVFQSEAEVIGRAIGRRPASLPENVDELRIEGYDWPCPFLQDNQCSIYAHRPTLCRSHLNMDADDLLCRLLPGLAVPVPYADARPIQWALVATSGRNERIADLRQWFPRADLES